MWEPSLRQTALECAVKLMRGREFAREDDDGMLAADYADLTVGVAAVFLGWLGSEGGAV